MIIEQERRGSVAILTINRPEARNAVNGEVAAGMEAALDECEADPSVRVVVITGAGSVFCAGADLKLVAAGRSGEVATRRGNFAGIVQRDYPKPLVAAVNGPALAGGFEVVLACDLVVAADHAIFGLPEASKALFAAAGALIRLPKRIPLALATEIAVTGDPIDAARAYEIGLVNRVVPGDRVLDEAVALAERIARNAPVAVRNTLRLLKEAGDLTEAEAWPRNFELSLEVFSHPDAIEGATAFAQKRPARWTGT